MPNTAIKVSHLTKVYKLYEKPVDRLKESLHPLKKKYHKDFYALNDVSFEIKKGETVGIIGKNGAGKSTLLKMITGVLTPSSGHVHVNGRISSLLELGAGFNPEYTGVENIYLQGTLMGYSHSEMESKIDEILAFADIGDFVYQPVKSYSSGMFARLAFAVAINVEPDILIVDEALSVGDSAFQRKCFARMEHIRTKGTTIVFVSHSEGQIVELCNRAIFIHGGQLVLDGEPKRVTGLYSKMMNSGNIDIEAIKEEFANPKKVDIEKNKEKNVLEQIDDEITNEEDDFEEFFDQSLMPEMSVEYQNQDVEIYDVEILTLKGKKINVLETKKEYIFSYKVKFFKEKKGIYFGMGINLNTGFNITGGNFPGMYSSLEYISENDIVEMNWKFECNLNEGVYFTQCGVLSEGVFLHRLVDSYGFKVMCNNKNFNTGIINMMLIPTMNISNES